jgi:hypothetical protein
MDIFTVPNRADRPLALDDRPAKVTPGHPNLLEAAFQQTSAETCRIS